MLIDPEYTGARVQIVLGPAGAREGTSVRLPRNLRSRGEDHHEVLAEQPLDAAVQPLNPARATKAGQQGDLETLEIALRVFADVLPSTRGASVES